MTEQEIYGAEQEFKRFEIIMNTQEYLTQEEYDFCFAWDKDIRTDTSYIGNYSELGVYLNLRVYSEHDHEKCNGDDVNNVSHPIPGTITFDTQEEADRYLNIR
jgi:hypothetical protein